MHGGWRRFRIVTSPRGESKAKHQYYNMYVVGYKETPGGEYLLARKAFSSRINGERGRNGRDEKRRNDRRENEVKI